MQTTHHSPTMLSYAQSLLDLASDKNQAEPIGEELGQLAQIINENPVFAAYIADPGISHEDRAKTLREVFGGKVSPLMWNFMGVLNIKRRLKDIPAISSAYDDLLDEKQGKVEVDVTVAHKLSPDQLKRAQQRISEALKREAVVHVNVDKSLIGGMMLRVQDKLIDASVRSQLQAMREQLLANRPK
jgi:F-type H+-transporting ATPase subunit delta